MVTTFHAGEIISVEYSKDERYDGSSIMWDMTSAIKAYSLDRLKELVAEYGLPRFRAKQLYQWLHTHHAKSYDDMTNLPKDMRAKLAEEHPLSTARMVEKQISADGTRKYIVELDDGMFVEMVGIPTFGDGEGVDKLTVCFSTQVGCPIGCTFCATGREGFTRNLTADEMVDQIVLVSEDFDARVSNVVAMGQGEPFLNFDEVLRALRIMNSADDLNIGARHITVSTCGIISGIEQMCDISEQFTLAVSLHAARQDVRDSIMPHLKNQSLARLKEALLDYVALTNRRVTLEYLLLEGVNDSEADLDALLNFCEGLHCHVNLLPFNAVVGSDFIPIRKERLHHWQNALSENGIETTVRHSRGSDIAGACGQLKNTLLSD